MSFKDWFSQQKSQLGDAVARYKNKDFMDAVVAGCVLVASADGDISAEEKQKMAGFIQRSDALSMFDMQQVITRFNELAENIEFDTELGQAKALQAVGKLRRDADAGRLLVRVCCAIGMADGEFDATEQAMVKTICRELGLPPEDFGLGDISPAPTPTPASPPEPAMPPPPAPAPTNDAPPAPPVAEPPALGPLATEKVFMEACIAVAAFVAAAESRTDRAALTQLVKNHAAFAAFANNDISKPLNRFMDNLGFSPAIGKTDVMQALAPIREDKASAQQLVQLGHDIANADGEITAAEQEALQAVSNGLGV